LLTEEQTREWAIGSWLLDYEAKLANAASEKERTAQENEQRDRIAALELRDDGTFTMSTKLRSESTETTSAGTWTVQSLFNVAAKTDNGGLLRFVLQPNGFLMQITETKRGYTEDWWKKIR
jgi:hypothetical protein